MMINVNVYELKQAAYDSDLSSKALHVFLYLTERANKELTCFPAIPTMAEKLHISISTVKRAIRELLERGFVEKEYRFRNNNRGQTSNLYTLCRPEASEKVEISKELKSEKESENEKKENNTDKNDIGGKEIEISISEDTHVTEKKEKFKQTFSNKIKNVINFIFSDRGRRSEWMPLNYLFNVI